MTADLLTNEMWLIFPQPHLTFIALGVPLQSTSLTLKKKKLKITLFAKVPVSSFEEK